MTNFGEVPFWSIFHVARAQSLSENSVLVPSPTLSVILTNSSVKKGSDNARLLCHFKAACQKFVVAQSGTGLQFSSDKPLAVRKSAEVLVRQASALEERWMVTRLTLIWMAANQLLTTLFQHTAGIQAAPVVDRKIVWYALQTNFLVVRCP